MIVKPIPKLHLYDRKQKIEGQKNKSVHIKICFFGQTRAYVPAEL